MPRPRNIIETRRVAIAFPEDVLARLDLHLASDLTGRIPHAAYQQFFSARIREFFAEKHLDLAPFLGTEPGGFVVRGEEAVIAALKLHLERNTK